MTIALGILASDGIAIAADTQETDGYFKDFALKIHSAMTKTDIHSDVNSAVAVTGAGSAVYLDAVADEIIEGFHKYQDTEVPIFESHLRERIEDFWARHVANKPDHSARSFDLIVGVQIENHRAMWRTDGSVVRRSVGFETVGTGGSYARMAIQRRVSGMNVQEAALLSILGVMQAKEYDQYCGKETTVTFLKDNLAYAADQYRINEAHKLFKKYAGIEYSAFLYALGKNSGDDATRPRKLNHWIRGLRKEFSQLASELSQDKP